MPLTWNSFVLLFIIFYCLPHEASIIQVPTISPSPSSTSPPQNSLLPLIDDILKDGKDHHCYRPCDEHNRTCYYHFKVEWYQSMSKACFDCPFNATDCGRKDCVVADGHSRPITVVNRKMPGPSIEYVLDAGPNHWMELHNPRILSTERHYIPRLVKEAIEIRKHKTFNREVCVKDKIIVDVENVLMASGTTIHWHGMHQKDTPYMDGTPYVTQCPIQPESTFRYEFTAEQPGTYFWHSHIGLQRGDGVAGALVIRQPKNQDIHGKLYDFDKSEHKLLITDWSDHLAIDLFTELYHSDGANRPSALLINGVGRFEVKDGNRSVMMSPARFDVEKGYRYRFRLINAEFLNCPVELSVDGHNITVMASDGSDLEPVTATSLVSYSGERFDFIINTNEKVDNYWIRVRGLLGCAKGPNEVRQVGILHYQGATILEPSELTWNSPENNGLQINSVNQAEEQTSSKPISKLKSVLPYDDSLKPVADYKFYIAYDLYAKNNSHFNKFPYYGYNQVKAGLSVATPQLNHISMKLPTSPLLVARPETYHFCNQSTVRKSCDVEYCQCPHVLSVKLHSTVELIIIDEGESFDSNHPFHLHGCSFRVVGQRRLDYRTTVEKVMAFENAGLMTRNLVNPPLKDTVTIPDGGYTIIRFKADNPGYWLFHCHIEFHAEVGMALVFKVGEHEDMLPVPERFPKCGDFENGGFKYIPEVVKDINQVKYNLVQNNESI